jgi:hypothetical protein
VAPPFVALVSGKRSRRVHDAAKARGSRDDQRTEITSKAPDANAGTREEADPAHFLKLVQAHKGAANILLILIDDWSFGHSTQSISQRGLRVEGAPSPTGERPTQMGRCRQGTDKSAKSGAAGCLQ